MLLYKNFIPKLSQFKQPLTFNHISDLTSLPFQGSILKNHKFLPYYNNQNFDLYQYNTCTSQNLLNFMKRDKSKKISINHDMKKSDFKKFLNDLIMNQFSMYDSPIIQEINFMNFEDQIFYQEYIKSLESKLLCKNLGDLRSNQMVPETMIDVVQQLIKDNAENCKVKIIQGEELKDNQMNLFYNVGKGSVNKPAYIEVRYQPNQDSDQFYAIVGKGVTYDTGGYNLKPTGYMEDMHTDKLGACTALSVFQYIVQNNIKVNVILALGMAENCISGNAYKPGDIIKSHSGKYVQIGNTDAEGRLVLGDCLSYVQDQYNILNIIELSTLTGACVVALGQGTSGLFSKNQQFVDEITKFSKQEHDKTWQLPLFQNHFDDIKADYPNHISNSGKSRYGGSSQAAAFLYNFIKNDCDYLHIDIAASASNKGFSTGDMVNTLNRYYESKQ